MVVVDKVYEFADAGEEGEFGVGGGAAFLVKVVVVFAEKKDILSSVSQVAFEQKIMCLNVFGKFREHLQVVCRR